MHTQNTIHLQAFTSHLYVVYSTLLSNYILALLYSQTLFPSLS